MDEAKEAGGGDFYDRVYSAARPELFFKATPHRVSGTGGKIGLRSDSKWTVPEPELALAVNSAGNIFGFTIGNDVSSRDIEGRIPSIFLRQRSTMEAVAWGQVSSSRLEVFLGPHVLSSKSNAAIRSCSMARRNSHLYKR